MYESKFGTSKEYSMHFEERDREIEDINQKGKDAFRHNRREKSRILRAQRLENRERRYDDLYD